MESRDKIRERLDSMKRGNFPAWCGFALTQEEYDEGVQIINNWSVYDSRVSARQKAYALEIFSNRKPR